MSVTTRPIAKDDEEVWKGLWEQYNQFYKRTIAPEVTKKTYERFLDDSVKMHAAVAVDPDSDKVVGFAHWYPHPSTSLIEDVVYLHDLFVDPSTRNKGAGRALIEHVYDHSKKELGAASVYWHTQYFNHRAQLLYVNVANRTDFVQYRHMLN